MIKQPHRIFYLIAIVFPVVVLLLMPKWTVDDAFISYRYAANLVHAGELTWNPGEAPVEGYTGILLPLLAAALLSLGLNVVTGIKILGVMACLGSAWLIRVSLRKLGVQVWIQALAVLIFLLAPMVYVHALSGLETMIYTFLLLSIVSMHLSLSRGEMSLTQVAVYALLLLLASLTRPEGVLFSLLSMSLLLLRHVRSGNQAFRRLAIALTLLFVLPGLAYFIWRVQYYGYLLPNSFSAKRFAGFINPESVKAAGRFVAYYVAIPLGLSLVLALLEADRIKARLQDATSGFQAAGFRSFAWLTLSFLGICLLVYFRSELFMNYASRFFLPFFPLLIIFAGSMLGLGWTSFVASKASHPLRHRYTMIALTVLAGLQLSIFAFKWRSELHFLNYYQAIVEQEYKPVAKFLKERLPANATIITYMDAGAIPYYSGLRTIDFGRLNDIYLARQRPDMASAVDYFFAQNADAVIMTSESHENYIYIDEAITILKDPRFVVFELAEIFGENVDFPYAQWIYVRKEL